MGEPGELNRLLADPSVTTAAAREAGLNVLRSHQQTGDPVVVWRDGRVAYLDQQEISRLIEQLTRDEAAPAPHSA
jgi:hypothetical protein